MRQTCVGDEDRHQRNPNMIMAKSPDFPATTHPLVVKAVIRWQGTGHAAYHHRRGSSGDSPTMSKAMKHVYHVCGMDALSRKPN